MQRPGGGTRALAPCAGPAAALTSSAARLAPSGVVAAVGVVVSVVRFAVLEEDLRGVLAQPVGDAGGILEMGSRGLVGAGMGAGGEGGGMGVGVDVRVDVVDVVVDVVGREEVGWVGFAFRGFEVGDYRGEGVFGLFVG